MIHYTMTK